MDRAVLLGPPCTSMRPGQGFCPGPPPSRWREGWLLFRGAQRQAQGGDPLDRARRWGELLSQGRLGLIGPASDPSPCRSLGDAATCWPHAGHAAPSSPSGPSPSSPSPFLPSPFCPPPPLALSHFTASVLQSSLASPPTPRPVSPRGQGLVCPLLACPVWGDSVTGGGLWSAARLPWWPP